MKAPTEEMKMKLKQAKNNFPNAHLAYNANTDSFFICYFSAEYYSSIFIIRL